MQILYLDNSYEDFLIIQDMLHRIHLFDCEVSFTENIEYAFDLYQRKETDICLLDFSCNSDKAKLFLKRIELFSHLQTPLIMIYQKRQQAIKRQALQLGVKALLEKYNINERSLAQAVSLAAMTPLHNLQHLYDATIEMKTNHLH